MEMWRGEDRSPLHFFTGLVVSDVGLLDPNCRHHPWSDPQAHADSKTPQHTYNVKKRAFFLFLYHVAVFVVLFLWYKSDFVYYFAYIIGWGYFFLLLTSILLQVGVGIYYRGKPGEENASKIEKTKVVVPTYLPRVDEEVEGGSVSVEEIHADMSSFQSSDGEESASSDIVESMKVKELARTLDGLLHTFNADDIVVVENRSGKVRPCASFIRLCCQKNVSYAYLPIGGKSIAAYYGGKYLTERKMGESERDWPVSDDSKIIMMMDDDVVLSKFFNMDTRMEWAGQCFQLTADYPNEEEVEGDPHDPPPMIEAAQDAEFHFAIRFKKMQDEIYETGVIAPHGAISAWKRDVFLEVMKEHDTAFDGEDLQMGLIFHRHIKGGKIIANAGVAAKTEVMSSLSSVCQKKEDDIGVRMKKSLFDQRVKSWYATQFRWSFISKYLLNVLCGHSGCCNAFGIRIWCLFQLLVILRDVLLRYAFIVIALLRLEEFLFMFQAFVIVFFFETLFVSLTVGWMYFRKTRGKGDTMYGKKLPITWAWVSRFVLYFMFYKLLIIVYHQLAFWYAVLHPLPSTEPIREIEIGNIPRGSPYLTLLTDLPLFRMVFGDEKGDVASKLEESWIELWEKGRISDVKVITKHVLLELVVAFQSYTENVSGQEFEREFDEQFRRKVFENCLPSEVQEGPLKAIKEYISDLGNGGRAFLVVVRGQVKYKGKVP